MHAPPVTDSPPLPFTPSAPGAIDDRPHLFGMRPADLLAHAAAHGLELREDESRRYLAQRLSYLPGTRPQPRRPISRARVAALEATLSLERLTLVERVTDESDGFVKYLFRSPDGALTEAVRIPLLAPGRFTVCLSSQVGCAMGCTFCATGRLGFTRNLAAWEMVDALLQVRDEAPGRVGGVVFQGQGEPFHNYDEVIRAAGVLSDPCGGRISADAITISTVGLVPQIRRFAREGHRFRLIVSLTSALPEKRRELLPVAGRFDLADLASAIREYAAVAKGRTTVAWVVMAGVNTGSDEVEALRALLGDLRLRVNLIDVNDPREDGFHRADSAELKAFMDLLGTLRVPLVRRYSGGSARHAACGMLAAVHCEAVIAPAPRGDG
jgi:23S rRNA (adenine2503-C2)-methyltransferase